MYIGPFYQNIVFSATSDVLGVLHIKLRRGCVEHPLIYMQVKGIQAKNLVTNLRKHSNRRSAIKTGHIDNKEICTWDDWDDGGFR